MKTNIEAKFKLIEILNISPVELSYIKDLTIPENIVSELLNGESGALKVHLENIQNDETLPVDTRLLAACLKNRMKDSVIRIKMDGLDEDEDDEVEEENYGYFDEDLTEEEKEAIKENEKERNKMWRDREIEFHKSIPILKKYNCPRFIICRITTITGYSPFCYSIGYIAPTFEYPTSNVHSLTKSKKIISLRIYLNTCRVVFKLFNNSGHVYVIQISRITFHVHSEDRQVTQITKLCPDII